MIGVFTTRFNWEFIYDIIDPVKIDEKSKLYAINSEGYIIASKDRSGTLETKRTHASCSKYYLRKRNSRIHN